MIDHLNILIHKGPFGGTAVVQVRYKYSPLDEGEARIVTYAPSVYDEAALNRLGGPGAFSRRYIADRIEAAVSELRGRYGPGLPVQNNIPESAIDRGLSIDGMVDDGARSAR